MSHAHALPPNIVPAPRTSAPEEPPVVQTFVAVEGPIGVGKTSLASLIHEEFGYHLLLETVADNPLLPLFYRDRQRWALHIETFFLVDRMEQLERTRELLPHTPVVSDYHILKNLIFSRENLPPRTYAKYETLYRIYTEDLPRPNVIVYLRASLATLQYRIALRGREYEKDMDPAYLERIRLAYEAYFADAPKRHPEAKILTFDGDRLDFVHDPEAHRFVMAELEKHLPRPLGREVRR
ncbi:MAG: Deoxyadenosine kinase [Brockia lithotrophica]|uniref:Deoxyadenosine kinase n=1 Tax=Brockia lithotrophica TaxID=933949 RepID=A0A2T5G5I4_9BACL|nr:deoxynucleoside kinase [Brockia lithotrophica]PTQ51425.1 MAG: Deoxyadenosine kinase [Brockia lithotrophica]